LRRSCSVNRCQAKQTIKNALGEDTFQFKGKEPIVSPEKSFTADEIKFFHNAIEQIKGLFPTEDEKNLYQVLINDRIQNASTLSLIPLFETDTMLRYSEFINCACIKTVIEGGVNDGYSTRNFCLFADTIYGFEPFIDCYEDKGSYRDGIKEYRKNVVVLPFGLWDKKGTVAFYKDPIDSHCSKVSNEQGNTIIETISIDEFVLEHSIKKVDFIKLDIEGAEYKALHGARKTLCTHRPQIAISIYHEKYDIFKIPLFLAGLLSQYTFRLAHNSEGITETVLYGIPMETQ